MKKILISFGILLLAVVTLLGPKLYYEYLDEKDSFLIISDDTKTTMIQTSETVTKLESFAHQYRNGNDFWVEEISFIGDEKDTLFHTLNSDWMIPIRELFHNDYPFDGFYDENSDRISFGYSSCFLIRSDQYDSIQEGLLINWMTAYVTRENDLVSIALLVDAETEKIYGASIEVTPNSKKKTAPIITELDFQDVLQYLSIELEDGFSYLNYYECDFHSESGEQNGNGTDLLVDYNLYGSNILFDSRSQNVKCIKLPYDNDYLCFDFYFYDLSEIYGYDEQLNSIELTLCVDELLGILERNQAEGYFDLRGSSMLNQNISVYSDSAD